MIDFDRPVAGRQNGVQAPLDSTCRAPFAKRRQAERG